MIAWKSMRHLIFLAGGVAAAAIFFGLGRHRKVNFIHNYEEAEYGPFIPAHSIKDGLAIYSIGNGEPLLLFPYPHGHNTAPMAEGELAQLLAGMDRRIITFDVPGAYRSQRKPTGDMAEMIHCADETLARLGVEGSVDVVGHSMSGLCALAYAIERPERVARLVLIGSMSGFPAVARWGLPGSAFPFWQMHYWRIIIWGMRLNSGRADLVLHKRLQNLMGRVCYYDKSFFKPLEIKAEDRQKGVPIRTIWSKNVYRRLSYADRLDQVRAPTLILAGRHDPQTPLPNSEELLHGIPDAKLFIFEQSGHSPFIEEAEAFRQQLSVLGATASHVAP